MKSEAVRSSTTFRYWQTGSAIEGMIPRSAWMAISENRKNGILRMLGDFSKDPKPISIWPAFTLCRIVFRSASYKLTRTSVRCVQNSAIAWGSKFDASNKPMPTEITGRWEAYIAKTSSVPLTVLAPSEPPVSRQNVIHCIKRSALIASAEYAYAS